MSEGKNGARNAPDPSIVQRTRKQQENIGQGLRHMFDSVLDEGVPDDFADLLDRLEEGEAKRGENDGGARE
ncbi:NepR family anti-sigma factor [Oceanicaulis sp. MMSF_3324]|uniref:NepR family anti-sigma factor n=1 Tax=Oceanicaulis sp. MMSF_3324 TaxID=3046702 RepID=UPI00273D5221|nr:NepR family anti-sigma factor [Oceanicaulis sp. MMSF_3324]